MNAAKVKVIYAYILDEVERNLSPGKRSFMFVHVTISQK